MSLARPSVSVLMPVRDGARFVAAAIASVCAQTHGDFEFLIIDDGSRDATPEILARAAAGDARIRIVTQPQAGLIAALNRGLRLARGAWVARMDADDIAAPQRLERQLGLAAAKPEAGAIGSFWRVVDAAGRFRRAMVCPIGPAAIAAALPAGNCLAHPSMMLRRAAVLACGGYRPAFLQAEDYDLWLRLSEQFDIHVVPETLLDYREHGGQVSWTRLEQRILSVLAAQHAARARRAGRVDGFDGAAPVDRTTLLAAGITAQEIEAALIEGSLNAAVDAVRYGQRAAARMAVGLLLRQKSLRLKTACHGWVLWMRSWLARG